MDCRFTVFSPNGTRSHCHGHVRSDSVTLHRIIVVVHKKINLQFMLREPDFRSGVDLSLNRFALDLFILHKI